MKNLEKSFSELRLLLVLVFSICFVDCSVAQNTCIERYENIEAYTEEDLSSLWVDCAKDLPPTDTFRIELGVKLANLYLTKFSKSIKATDILKQVAPFIRYSGMSHQKRALYISMSSGLSLWKADAENGIVFHKSALAYMDSLVNTNEKLYTESYFSFAIEFIDFFQDGGAENTSSLDSVYQLSKKLSVNLSEPKSDKLFELSKIYSYHYSSLGKYEKSLDILESVGVLNGLSGEERFEYFSEKAMLLTYLKRYSESKLFSEQAMNHPSYTKQSLKEKAIVDNNIGWNLSFLDTENQEKGLVLRHTYLDYVFNQMIENRNSSDFFSERTKLYYFYLNVYSPLFTYLRDFYKVWRQGGGKDEVSNAANYMLRFMGHVRNDKEYYTSVPQMDWRDIQSVLRKDEIAIQTFYKTEHAFDKLTGNQIEDSLFTFLLVISKDKPLPDFYKFPRVVNSKFHLFNSMWTNVPPGQSIQLGLTLKEIQDSVWAFEGKKYYELLKSYNCPNLIIGGTGDINAIPLGCVLNIEKGTYFDKEFTVSNFSNIYDIVESRRQKSLSLKNACIMHSPDYGYPQKYGPEKRLAPNFKYDYADIIENLSLASQKDAENVKNKLQQRPTLMSKIDVFEGDSATSAKFLSIKDYGIVHLITHGHFVRGANNIPIEHQKFFRFDDIGLSINLMQHNLLFFAGVNHTINDSTITKRVDFVNAQDVCSMDLKGTELVMLSACSAMRGTAFGDDIYGMYRAFRLAGAKSVIGCAWAIEPSVSAHFNDVFYTEWLQKGHSKAKAIRLAQKSIRETKGWEHPYYWAGFQIWGE